MEKNQEMVPGFIGTDGKNSVVLSITTFSEGQIFTDETYACNYDKFAEEFGNDAEDEKSHILKVLLSANGIQHIQYSLETVVYSFSVIPGDGSVTYGAQGLQAIGSIV